MPRGSTSRRWIKVYCRGMLHGSIVYQLTEVEYAIWVKLMLFAGEINRDGQISDNDGRPLPHDFIAHELHTTPELLESTLKKCKGEGRLVEDEHGLHITNWKAYQSEYDRQKPFREAKKVKEQLPLEEEPISSGLYQNYEKEIGVISPAIADDLKDFSIYCRESNMPVDWISEAFAEAAKNNKRNWAYVKAILNRWISEGKGKPKQDKDKEIAEEWEAKHRKLKGSPAD
jgi:DnaD/phage-associated family protein